MWTRVWVGGSVQSEFVEKMSQPSALTPPSQVLAELEGNWWHNVEDMAAGKTAPNEAFFFNFLRHEVSEREGNYLDSIHVPPPFHTCTCST